MVLGGGSAIDTAKVLSRLLIEPGLSLKSMLNSPTQDVKKSIKLIAIPTTSGTGAEVTPFATVWDSVEQKKHSLIDVTPDVAILDPSLTLTLGYQDTLYPALDALSHALESLWNKNRTSESEEYAIEAIHLICNALAEVLENPKNLIARKEVQRAATLAGLAISQTRTAIAHAISYPLTLMYGVPHGLACSFTLAAIIREVGAVKLNLSNGAVDKVLDLLFTLGLDKEMAKFVDVNQALSCFNEKLDPSRAGNFTLPIDQNLLHSLLVDSFAKPAGRVSS